MPRLGSNFHSLFDEAGVFVGLTGVPSYREVLVKHLEVVDAMAYRSERRYNDNRPYYATLKQPQILIKYKQEVFYIVDRRVLWDLIRNFDPEIDYRTFLEMLEYFSVYKIVEDYLLDYADKTLGVWLQQTEGGEKIIVSVQTTDEIQDVIHEEIIRYVGDRIEIDATESFMKVGKSAPTNTTPKRHRSQILQIIKDDMILEIKDWMTRGKVEFRRLKEHEGYMVQMMKRITFKKNLAFIPSDVLYSKINDALEIIQTKYERTIVKTDYRPRGKMEDHEWDAIQYLWFMNYFSKVDG